MPNGWIKWINVISDSRNEIISSVCKCCNLKLFIAIRLYVILAKPRSSCRSSGCLKSKPIYFTLTGCHQGHNLSYYFVNTLKKDSESDSSKNKFLELLETGRESKRARAS